MGVTHVMTSNDPNLRKGQDFLWHEIISQHKKGKLTVSRFMPDDPSSIKENRDDLVK